MEAKTRLLPRVKNNTDDIKETLGEVVNDDNPTEAGISEPNNCNRQQYCSLLGESLQMANLIIHSIILTSKP